MRKSRSGQNWQREAEIILEDADSVGRSRKARPAQPSNLPPRFRQVLVTLLVLVALDAICAASLLTLAHVCCSDRLAGGLPSKSAIVLLGTLHPEDLKARTEEVRRLALLNPDSIIVCAGGNRPNRGLRTCERVIEHFASMGFSRDRLIADRRSSDTQGNLEAAFAVIPRDATAVLVSDAMHLMRAGYLVRHVAPAHRLVATSAVALGYPAVVRRIHWEIVAWSVEVLPKAARDWALAFSRF